MSSRLRTAWGALAACACAGNEPCWGPLGCASGDCPPYEEVLDRIDRCEERPRIYFYPACSGGRFDWEAYRCGGGLEVIHTWTSLGDASMGYHRVEDGVMIAFDLPSSDADYGTGADGGTCIKPRITAYATPQDMIDLGLCTEPVCYLEGTGDPPCP